MCWEIWKARSKFIFEKCEPDPVNCINKVTRLINEHWNTREKRNRRRDGEISMGRKVKWEKPCWGKVKLNVDAAFNLKTRKAAIGVIGRTGMGDSWAVCASVLKPNQHFRLSATHC